MDDVEKDIQKKLVNLCQALPVHVELWKKVLQELQNPVKALGNFAEQLRYVESADIKYMQDFDKAQNGLQIKILHHIEEELASIKQLTDKLHQANNDFKNKLTTLERTTVDLDWDLNSRVIKGSPIQPSLDKVLQMAYQFWIYFLDASKTIGATMKNLNIRQEQSIKDFQKAFALDLESGSGESNNKVYEILALTQYVINNKAVT